MTFFFTDWFNYKGSAFGSLPPHTGEPLSPQGLYIWEMRIQYKVGEDHFKFYLHDERGCPRLSASNWSRQYD
jgi:hypothetical protein